MQASRTPGATYVSEGGTELPCSVADATPRLVFVFGLLPWDACGGAPRRLGGRWGGGGAVWTCPQA